MRRKCIAVREERAFQSLVAHAQVQLRLIARACALGNDHHVVEQHYDIIMMLMHDALASPACADGIANVRGDTACVSRPTRSSELESWNVRCSRARALKSSDCGHVGAHPLPHFERTSTVAAHVAFYREDSLAHTSTS